MHFSYLGEIMKKSLILIVSSFLFLSIANVEVFAKRYDPCCDPCAVVKPEKKLTCEEELKLAKKVINRVLIK